MDVVSLSAEFPNDNPALHRGAIWVVTHPTAAPTAELPQPPAVIAEVEVAPLIDAPVLVPVPVPVPETEPAPAPALVLLEPAPAHVAVEEEEEPPSLFEQLVAEMAPSRPSGIIAIPPEARLDTFEIEEDGEDDVLIEEIEPLVEAVIEGAAERLAPAPPAPRAPLESDVVLAEAANDVESATSLPPPPDDPFTVLLYTLADVAMAAGSPHVASVLPALLLEGRLADLPDLPEEARMALAEASILEGEGVSAGFARTLEAWKAILRGTSDDFEATGGVMLDEWAASLLARLLGAPAKSETLRRDLRSRGVAAFGLAA